MTLGRFLKGKLWLSKGDFLEILACWGGGALFFEVVGNLLYFLIARSDSTSHYFPLGPLMLLSIGACFMMFLAAARFVLYFQMGVQMSITRRRMLVGEWMVNLLSTVLVLALTWAVFWLDQLLIAPLWGGTLPEDALIQLMPWWVWPLIGAVALLMGFLCGALVARFGLKGFWALWGVFVGGSLLISALGDGLDAILDQLVPFFQQNALLTCGGGILLATAVLGFAFYQMLRFPVK